MDDPHLEDTTLWKLDLEHTVGTTLRGAFGTTGLALQDGLEIFDILQESVHAGDELPEGIDIEVETDSLDVEGDGLSRCDTG